MEDKREVKLCRQCRHFKQAEHVCFHREVLGHDLVDGSEFGANPYVERAVNGRCGPEGKLWEAKTEAA